MKQTTKYVAFDVHQATTVASVRYDSPRTRAYSGRPRRCPAVLLWNKGKAHRRLTAGSSGQSRVRYALKMSAGRAPALALFRPHQVDNTVRRHLAPARDSWWWDNSRRNLILSKLR